uniref:Uncharacterized protein n=1 Tax=Anguilla anguilla TaxID=7936 RepID=A0A0E9PNU3_ANGAN
MSVLNYVFFWAVTELGKKVLSVPLKLCIGLSPCKMTLP